VTRTESDGTVTVIAERYQGRRLNSPNDVVVAADGSVYFTDPPYGLPNQSEGREIPFNGVFRLAPDGSLSPIAEDFERPNGLALSPDGRTLYVDDTARHHIRAFDVGDSGGVTGGAVFAELRSAEPGGPDGLKVDVEGNVYCTGSGGIWVFAATGRKLGRIVFPELPANLGWGESDWRTLFATARTGVYRLRVEVAGLPVS
jgi:gluconolactonase